MTDDFEGFDASQTDLEDQTTYPATLIKLTKKMLPSSFSETGEAEAIIWTFGVEGSEETVDGTTSLATGPRSKARPWFDALLGKGTASDMMKQGGVKKDALIGRECTVLIAINDNGYPKVSNVLPPQKRQNAPQATEQAEVDTETPPPPDEPPAPSDAPWERWAK